MDLYEISQSLFWLDWLIWILYYLNCDRNLQDDNYSNFYKIKCFSQASVCNLLQILFLRILELSALQSQQTVHFDCQFSCPVFKISLFHVWYHYHVSYLYKWFLSRILNWKIPIIYSITCNDVIILSIYIH